VRIAVSDATRDKSLSKHQVNMREVEMCFENRDGATLIDTREDHRTDPPTQWFIAETNQGRMLIVCFVLKAGVCPLKTAYEPNAEECRIYKTHAM
jgi:uncharacterized DUF497 family protein